MVPYIFFPKFFATIFKHLFDCDTRQWKHVLTEEMNVHLKRHIFMIGNNWKSIRKQRQHRNPQISNRHKKAKCSLGPLILCPFFRTILEYNGCKNVRDYVSLGSKHVALEITSVLVLSSATPSHISWRRSTYRILKQDTFG